MASARDTDLYYPVHCLVTVKMTLSRLSPTDDMHSKRLFVILLLLVVNLLVPNNTCIALQGAGFSFLTTQQMCWPIMVILVQPCWGGGGVFPSFLLYLHIKLHTVI
jgi:hypothetical protein